MVGFQATLAEERGGGTEARATRSGAGSLRRPTPPHTVPSLPGPRPHSRSRKVRTCVHQHPLLSCPSRPRCWEIPERQDSHPAPTLLRCGICAPGRRPAAMAASKAGGVLASEPSRPALPRPVPELTLPNLGLFLGPTLGLGTGRPLDRPPQGMACHITRNRGRARRDLPGARGPMGGAPRWEAEVPSLAWRA